MKGYILSFLLCTLSTICFSQFHNSAEVDSVFQEWDKSDVPGCALGIVKDGSMIYSKGYGSADLEHDIEIEPSSVFYIGSVSKQFVTFCILLLEEDGKLDLDDKIQKYLPDFPEYDSPLTIRHFIHHTSGVRDYLTLMYLKGRNYLDHAEVEEVYDLIKRQKELNFSPGEKYLYSNSCYFMLAMIVEKAAGESLREFAHKNIFQPLGMNSSLFYDDNTDLIKNRVFSYEKKNDGDGFNNLIMRFDLVGSGGVYSSVDDLLLWDQNFYNNKLGKGGQDIIYKMHEEGLLNNGESSGYAFALNNGNYKGLKTVSHGGALGGYRAQLMRFPEENFSIIILANRGDANPTRKAYEVADILLKEKFIQESNDIATQDDQPEDQEAIEKISIDHIPGNYEIQPGVVLEITLKNDSLQVLQSWDESSYSIFNSKGNTFEIPDEPSVQFVFSDVENNSPQILTIFQNGNETICKRVEPFNPSSLNMEEYTGKYDCEELDFAYTFYIEEEMLKVKIANYEPYELKAFEKDNFISEGNLFRFKRQNGAIDGFELDAGRVTNLKFEKSK